MWSEFPRSRSCDPPTENTSSVLLNARHEVERVESQRVDRPSARGVPASGDAQRGLDRPGTQAPFGHPEPSEDDLSITKRLRECGELPGIGVLDHVIIAKRGVVSFHSRDMLQLQAPPCRA